MGHDKPAEISNHSLAFGCYFNVQARGFVSKPCQSYITVSDKNILPDKIEINSFFEGQPTVADDRHILLK